MFLVWLVVIFAIGAGVVMIFFRDLWWDLTHLGNRAQGLASQRNDIWDAVTVFRGFLSLGAGIVLLMLALGAQANENARLSEAATVTAQHRSALDRIDERLRSHLIEWRDIATEQLRYARIGDLHVFYGRCPDETDFYTIVYDPVISGRMVDLFLIEVYVYSEGMMPRCVSRILNIFGEFRRLRENWFVVPAIRRYADLFTPTPTQAPTRTPTLVF
jgi:hypothetical protein